MKAKNEQWQIKDRILDLAKRPLVMGILNVTPDSFSDGGRYFDTPVAVARALEMVKQGADIIDVGGESTRPGAESVPAQQELDRVVPVIKEIASACSIPLSIDTTKAAVAEAAIEAGAHIINDISGLNADPKMAEVAAKHQCGLVLMHMQGQPRTMQFAPHYEELMGEIVDFLKSSLERATDAGAELLSTVVDPGIGFGKTWAHNWQILQQLNRLAPLGRPILIGASRKRFLREQVGDEPRAVESATLAAHVAACLNGARIVRVHDVFSHRHAMDVVGALQ